MILFGDYHTHTIYSGGKHNVRHAKGSVLENALIAKDKGLKEIAITEHGFNHKLYGLQRSNLKKLKSEIEEAKTKTGINILLGIEANIISSLGDIDVNESDMQYIDFLVVGFHTFARAKSIKEFFKFYLPNNLGFHDKKTIERNTLALLMAMDKYNIDVISHPGSKMCVDFKALAKGAEKTNTMLEINGRRIMYSNQDVQDILKTKAMFIIDSDAHTAHNVGGCNYPINFAIKNDIPFERIANYGKRPIIKSEK